MKHAWPISNFESFLRHRKEFFRIDDLATYKRARVQLHWQGILLRDIVAGAEVKTKEQQAARVGELLVAEIDAKVGGVGIVPPDLDGAIVSSHYFLFEIDETKCSRKWLDFFIRSGTLEDQLIARGSTNYAAIRPHHVLQCEMPLPPLDEQRRIVSRIEELAAKIEEAQKLHHEATPEAKALLMSEAGRVFSQLARRWAPQPFRAFDPHVTSGPRNWAKHYQKDGHRFYRAQDIGPDGEVLPDSKVFLSPPPGDQGRSAMLQIGDLMLVITGATVGRCAVFRSGLERGFVSQHVGICRLPDESVEPDFVLWGLRAPQGQTQLLGQRYGQGKPGLNLSNIRALTLPFPPLLEQRRAVAYLDNLQTKVESLKQMQTETAAELAFLMPSILSRAFRGDL